MTKLSEVWAKSDPKENLEDHTNEALKIWSQLRSRYRGIIDDKIFWQESFYAVAFHDFGKICDNFQDIIKKKKPSNNDERIRHEFFSGMFLYANNYKYYQNRPESLIAIFSHHKPFNDSGFNKQVKRNRVIQHRIEKNLLDEFTDFVNSLAIHYQVEPFKPDPSLKYFILNKYREIIRYYLKNIYEPLEINGFMDQKRRDYYIFHKAILNISDWSASGHINLEGGVDYSSDFLKQKIVLKLINEGRTEIAKAFKFRKFQTMVMDKKNVIVVAPTGSGKTEAALLWASQKKDWERMIYLLPTRVTSNAIYKRLIAYFGNDKLQLIHSTARLYIKEQVDNSYDKKKYFRDKSFFKNINVCTIDQILTLGFNLGFWEVKTFHMLNAKVIIDEIHLYSPYTLGLIISTIKYLKGHFSTSFFIMTATMPKKLLNLLTETLGEVEIIKDQELLDATRNTFETKEETLDGLLKEIEEQIRQKKKTLVVVNTVDKAIELYERLEPIATEAGVKAICYHARFINQDRPKKEEDIFALEKADRGGILIATQVVEVSLDIDFDILFTENAPIDAIIQRAGRVNRKREKENGRVIIARHFEISKKIYDTGNVLHDTFEKFSKVNRKRLTENDLTQMVDDVYANLDITQNEDYQNGLKKHLDIQYRYRFIKDLISDEKVFTRENLNTISVIPEMFYEKLLECKDEDEFNKYELSVSNKRVFLLWPKSHDNRGLRFIKGNYSYEKGLIFKEGKP